MRAALARGEEVNQRYAEGDTGLMNAARRGHEAVVEILLQEPGLDVNLAGGIHSWTALHAACYGGHAGIVRRLLSHPSLTCPNAVDGNGNSPLGYAVMWDNVECVRELVAVEGVHLETTDPQGWSLEKLARIQRSLEAWQVVREELGRREDVKDKWQKETIDNLVDFNEGNNKKMVTKKKKKRKLLKVENTQAGSLHVPYNSLEKKDTRKLARSINNEPVSSNENVNFDPLVEETDFEGDCADDLLNKDIEDKLQVLKDKQIYANKLSESKAKEMADLLLDIGTAEDMKSKGIKEINHIDD